MKINSISNINFGVRYTPKMTELLEKSRAAAEIKGKDELDEWDKIKKDIDNIAPDSFTLFTKLWKENNTMDIKVENPETLKFSLLRLKIGEPLDLENMKKILIGLNVKKNEYYNQK